MLRLFQGAAFLPWLSRWSLVQLQALGVESESLAGFAVTD
jgi:hypothetical protein